MVAIMPAVWLDDLGHAHEVRAALGSRFFEQSSRAFARAAIAGEATALSVADADRAERRGSGRRIAVLDAHLLRLGADCGDGGDTVACGERKQHGAGKDSEKPMLGHDGRMEGSFCVRGQPPCRSKAAAEMQCVKCA